MSFFTTYDFFTNAATNGVEAAQWVNEGNCVTDPGYAQIDFGANPNNDLLLIDTAKSAQEIPGGTPWAAGVTIIGISVQLLVRPIWVSATGGTIFLTDIQIGSWTAPPVSFFKSTDDGIDQLVTVGDTLANMGFSQLDAQNFADGITDFRFQTVNPSPGGICEVRCYTAKAQFEYDYSGGGGSPVGVQVPRLF